jgi:hypothetical protein
VKRIPPGGWRWLLLALAAAGALALALDGRHYWHDARFLFATTHFPFSDVLDGRFNPDQAWGVVDERSSAGFYTSKVAHLWLLRSLFAAVPPHAGGLDLAVALSALLMLAAALLAGLIIARVTDSRGLGWAGAVAFLLLPVTPYLAGKQVAEVTALPFTAAALLLVWSASRQQNSKRRWLVAVAAGAFLFVASASRMDSLFSVLGFLLMTLWLADSAHRKRVAGIAAVTVGVAGLAYGVLLAAIGTGPGDYARYLHAFLTAPSRPMAMSALSLAVFAGVLYPLAALAWLSHRRRAVAFFAGWWAVTWLPSILITSAFMVEPRYLAHGALPLAGLIALGGEALGRRLTATRPARAAGLAILLVLPANWLAIQLMPYELDRPRLLAAVDRIVEESPDAAILVPWTYTDLNFLRAARPHTALYSVHSPEGLDVTEEMAAMWHARYSDWYGGKHVSQVGALSTLLDTRPVYYLGWHRYPPVEFVEGVAARVRLDVVAAALRRLDLLDHLETSWVRASPELRLDPAGEAGMYRWFRLARADAGSAPTPPHEAELDPYNP